MPTRIIKIANSTNLRNNAMGRQFILPINNSRSEYSPHDFIFSNCNSVLQRILSALPASAGVNPYPNITLLMGPKKSGKTHFAHVFIEASRASWITPESNIANLKGVYFIVDDIDNGFQEEDLFHLFNYICENNKIAIFTCTNLNCFKLLDLKSRLGSVRVFNIDEPDDIMIKSLLSKHLAGRSLHVSEDVIKFLVTRIPRSFESIFKSVDFIDKLSLEQKRNISVNFLSSLEFPF